MTSKLTKNCERCMNSYSPYVIGEESEWWNAQCILPLCNEEGKIIPPQGLCSYCNPKVTKKREFFTDKETGYRYLITDDGKYYLKYGEKILIQ